MTTLKVDGPASTNIYDEISFFTSDRTSVYSGYTRNTLRIRLSNNSNYAYLTVDASNYDSNNPDSLNSLNVIRFELGSSLTVEGVSVSLNDYDKMASRSEEGKQLYESLVMGGNDEISVEGGRVMGYSGADIINGDDRIQYNDWIHGNHGADVINSYKGNDTVRGGHGHDKINLGEGSDWVWGGIGQNEIEAGSGNLTFNGRYWERHEERSDGHTDQIFIPVDLVKNPNGNTGGVNADFVWGVGVEDQIFIHGVDDSAIEFREFDGDSHRFWKGGIEDASGVGIYANGILEAVIPGELSVVQVDQITNGGFFA